MRRLHALVLVPLVGLAACSAPTTTPTSAAPSAPASSAPATSAPASSAPASDGKTVTGDGYTLTLPEGWADATADFKKIQPAVDSGGRDPKDSDGFLDNANVVTQSSPAIPLEQLKTAYQQQLETAGSTDIEFKPNVKLDGVDALAVWSKIKDAKAGAHTIQYIAFNNNKLYFLTVTTNRNEAKAGTLADQIVGGWKWTA